MARKRLFFGGSRQAPDPFDQFLEERGFYRKHTARDASCLFRVISEQLYDTQMHHLNIREECIQYMKRNSQKYEDSVHPKTFDMYLEDLGKIKTYGTLLELMALAYRYQCNVLLFEAFNVGRWYVKEANFHKCFKVFFTPEKHFDSIYDNNYIEDLAFTQGLCYEILYQEVFNLPDIMFAVECMLHDASEDTMQFTRKIINKKLCDIAISIDREFILDRPENTSCILDNYELCHFHNKDFFLFASNLRREAETCNGTQDRHKINRKLESLLPIKALSCVRQLLNDGITPFPYKVAKGLDVDIYRNIEFDAWSDCRKYKRFQYSANRFQVGLKCNARLRSSTSSVYNAHIQAVIDEKAECLVYIEELGEKKLVPYSRLQVVEKRSRWDNFHYRLKRSITNKNQEYDCKTSYQKMHKEIHRGYPYLNDNNRYYEDNLDDSYMAMKEYNNYRNFVAPPPYEFVAMPIIRSENSYNKKGSNEQKYKSTEKQQHPMNNERKEDKEVEEIPQHSEIYPSCDGPYGYYEQVLPFPFDPNIPPPPQLQPQYLPASVPASNYNHGVYYNPIYSTGQHNNASAMYPAPPPGIPFGSIAPNPINGTFIHSGFSNETALLIPIKRKELLQSHLPINFGINPSYNPNGHDIPTQDLVSVRFFYNLGHEYFKHLHTAFGMQGITNLIHGIDNLSGMYDPSDHLNSDVKALANDLQVGLSLKESETTVTQQQQHQSKTENIQHGRRYHKSNNNSNNTTKKDTKSPHSTKNVYAHKGNKCSSKKDVKDQLQSPTGSASQVQLESNYTIEYPNNNPEEQGQVGYFQYVQYPQYQAYNPYNSFERENIAYVMQPTYVPATYAMSPGMQPTNIEPYGYGSLDNTSTMVENSNYSYSMLYPTPMSATAPPPGQLWYPPTYATLIPVAQPPLVVPSTAGTYNTSMNASSVSQ